MKYINKKVRRNLYLDKDLDDFIKEESRKYNITATNVINTIIREFKYKKEL